MATIPGTVRKYFSAEGTRYSARTRVTINGVRRQIEKRGFATERQALDYLAQVFRDEQNGKYSFTASTTMSDYLYRWMETRRIAPSTRQGDENRIRNHVVPYIGSYLVTDINPDILNYLYLKLEKKNLGPGSIRKVHELLSGMFKHAQLAGVVEINPVSSPRTIPPRPREIQESKKPIVAWTSAQVDLFVSWLDPDDPFALAWYLALFAGLRRSEICFLSRADYNESLRMLKIRGGVTSVYDRVHRRKTLYRGATKSGKDRSVSVDTLTHTQLVKKQDGQYYPISPDQLGKEWERLCKRLFRDHPGLAPMTLHGLRHTHASILLEAGVHPKVVQERLGHSSITVTMGTYSHLIPTAQQDAVKKMEGLFG